MKLKLVIAVMGVGTLVEGSVTESGDSLRIVVQLVDARPRTHLGSWAWTLPVSHSASNRAWVDLPEPSPPSSAIPDGRCSFSRSAPAAWAPHLDAVECTDTEIEIMRCEWPPSCA